MTQPAASNCNQISQPTDCSFQQYTGPTPVTDHTTGALFIAVGMGSISDPSCTHNQPVDGFLAVLKSTDGGAHWVSETVAIDGLHDFVNAQLGYGKGLYDQGYP